MSPTSMGLLALVLAAMGYIVQRDIPRYIRDHRMAPDEAAQDRLGAVVVNGAVHSGKRVLQLAAGMLYVFAFLVGAIALFGFWVQGQ